MSSNAVYLAALLLFNLGSIQPTGAQSNGGDNATQDQAKFSLTGSFLLGKPVELNSSDPLEVNLFEIVGRNGPDMRPSRDYKDFKDITLNVSTRAWSLMHEHFKLIMEEKTQLLQPVVDEMFNRSKVSGECREAIHATFEGAREMKSWAIKMFNSWGQFPMSGIFEGTYGDPGSFHTCVSVKDIHRIDHAHYCSLTFRPVLPSLKDYELVVRKEPKELLELFSKVGRTNNTVGPIETGKPNDKAAANSSTQAEPSLRDRQTSRDALSDILVHAQYHHYVYYKLGSCWPIACTPVDIRRVVKSIARRNVLMHGPVKCYSKFADDYNEEFEASDIDGSDSKHDELVVGNHSEPTINSTYKVDSTNSTKRKLVISIWDKNDGIFIWKPHFNRPHWIALTIIVAASVFILLMTLIDIVCNRVPLLMGDLRLAIRALPLASNSAKCVESDDSSSDDENGAQQPAATLTLECHEGPVTSCTLATPASCMKPRRRTARNNLRQKQVVHLVEPKPFFWSLVDDCSMVTNARQFFRVSEGQMRNDILCLNGIRCITMIWIIMTHTMMYNDWSAFARTRHVEVALSSLLSQPLFNGSYLVDTFFLMSGLLSAFTAFKHSQGLRTKFNSFAYIFGRWLRLTPQIFFVSMMFIVLPAISSGPHWFPIVGEYSENCQTNWWINVLHLQAFYKKHEMCNFVTWWISIDFFYHYFALMVIWIIMLTGHKFGFLSMGSIVLGGIAVQCYRHYDLGLPPSILATIPQTGAMWTTMTLDFFWTPYTHVVPFFFGFYIGYLMALKRKLVLRQLNTRRALIGWTLSTGALTLQSYSTFLWVIGEAEYSKATSTVFYTICQIVWAASLCWIIIACHHNYGGFVDRVLSWKVFIVLGKASYLVYLSHFQVLFLNFGNQNLLLEPSVLMMILLVVGNIFLSTLLGIFLCVVFELPWLKTHRRLMKYV